MHVVVDITWTCRSFSSRGGCRKMYHHIICSQEHHHHARKSNARKSNQRYCSQEQCSQEQHADESQTIDVTGASDDSSCGRGPKPFKVADHMFDYISIMIHSSVLGNPVPVASFCASHLSSRTPKSVFLSGNVEMWFVGSLVRRLAGSLARWFAGSLVG